jgi:hypothetical protein
MVLCEDFGCVLITMFLLQSHQTWSQKDCILFIPRPIAATKAATWGIYLMLFAGKSNETL